MIALELLAVLALVIAAGYTAYGLALVTSDRPVKRSDHAEDFQADEHEAAIEAAREARNREDERRGLLDHSVYGRDQ